jgi:hypothetical protein
MNLSYLALGAFALSLSVVIDADAPPESHGSATTVTVAGGTGHYAIIDRGCEGQVLNVKPVTFHDGAADIEHRFANGVTLGLRSGVVDEQAKNQGVATILTPVVHDSTVTTLDEHTNAYVNPNIALEEHVFGVGVGWVHAQHGFELDQDRKRIDPSFHLRIGPLAGSYFRIGYMESVPLLSGGGYLDIGLGLHPARRLDVYAGLSTMPYDASGLTLRAAYRVLPNWALSARGRVGFSSNAPENGIAMGVTFTTEPMLEPEPVKNSRE